MCKNQSGFTLIELILVLALITILAGAYAMPLYINVQAQAWQAQRNATAAAVYDGLQSEFSDAILSNTGAYPNTLDIAPIGACVLRADLDEYCFSEVLQLGVTQNWNKTGNLTYLHTGTNSTFTYDDANGTFLCTGNC